MKKLSKELLKKFFIGTLLFLFSFLPLRETLLKLSFTNSTFDFFFVLFAIAFPHIIRSIAIAIIVSVIFFSLKSVALPRGVIEKEIYKLKKRRFFKNLFYGTILIGPLIFPFRSGIIIFNILSNLVSFSPYFSFLSFLLLPFSFMDLTLFLEALLISFFLLHLLKIISVKFGTVIIKTKNKVIEEGKESEFIVTAESRIPLFCFFMPPFKMKVRVNKANFIKTKYELILKKKFPIGYYRLDILQFRIATFPFFFSTVFKTVSNSVELTVLPKIKMKNVLYSKNPFAARETGDLVKRVSGGSLEFSGIKEFSPGDPVSKIWWKGLAKGGKLLKKDFFSLAEDRWILMVDLSNPNMSRKDEETLLTFSRAFVETFTRKDIEIGIHIISPNASTIKYSTKKRELMSFLIKHWHDFKHLSYKGSKLILKDAVGNIENIEKRCKASGISLSSFVYYAGLIKKPKKTFYWGRTKIFKKNLKSFTTTLKKSGKMLVVTAGMPEDLVDEIKKVARVKKCPVLFASLQKVPKARTFIIPKQHPEKMIWRLMYA